MLWHPLARLKIGAAFFTPASNSASMPGLTSICAISVIIGRSIAPMIVYDCNDVLPQCAFPIPVRLGQRHGAKTAGGRRAGRGYDLQRKRIVAVPAGRRSR